MFSSDTKSAEVSDRMLQCESDHICCAEPDTYRSSPKF